MVFYKDIKAIKMQPKVLYGVGLGPGDPKWITLEAISILNQSKVVAFITGLKGKSRAEKIGQSFLSSSTKKVFLKMPDSQADNPNTQDWHEVVNKVQNLLKENNYLSIACLGDPLMYGSFTQILSLLPENINVKIVPGLWSGSVASAEIAKPWVTYNDSLVILSALLEKNELSKRIKNHNCMVFIKVYGNEKKIYSIIKENNLHLNSWLVQELGVNQSITPFTKTSKANSYFALVWAKTLNFNN